MTDWKTVKLGDVVEFQRGHDLSKNEFIQGEYPIAGSNGIIGYHNQFTTKAPGITIGRSGNIGNAHFYINDFWAHNTTLYVKEFKNCDPKFIYYLLKTLDFSSHNSGSAVPSLNRNYIHPIEIIVPSSIQVQKKIAKVLGDLDDKIELNRRMNETLEEMAMAVYRHYFVHFGLPPGAKEEATECPFGKLIEHPEMGMIPEGWSVGKLGDVVNTISGGTPSRNNDLYFLNANIKWVKSKELHGGFIFDTEEKITEDALKNSAAKLLPENSILIALYGATVGEYAILANEATCNQAVCALIPNTDLPFTYLFIFIKSNKENFKNLAIGSAQQNISQILIKNQFLIIDKKAIRVYHERVRKIFALIKSNSQEIQSLTETRNYLLPRLLSGDVRVE